MESQSSCVELKENTNNEGSNKIIKCKHVIAIVRQRILRVFVHIYTD